MTGTLARGVTMSEVHVIRTLRGEEVRNEGEVDRRHADTGTRAHARSLPLTHVKSLWSQNMIQQSYNEFKHPTECEG